MVSITLFQTKADISFGCSSTTVPDSWGKHPGPSWPLAPCHPVTEKEMQGKERMLKNTPHLNANQGWKEAGGISWDRSPWGLEWWWQGAVLPLQKQGVTLSLAGETVVLGTTPSETKIGKESYLYPPVRSLTQDCVHALRLHLSISLLVELWNTSCIFHHFKFQYCFNEKNKQSQVVLGICAPESKSTVNVLECCDKQKISFLPNLKLSLVVCSNNEKHWINCERITSMKRPIISTQLSQEKCLVLFKLLDNCWDAQ